MALNKKLISTFSKATHSYENHALIQKKSLYFLSQLFPKLNLSSKTVLDFGCGTGLSLDYLKGFKKIYGLEPCESFLEHFQKRATNKT